MNFINLTRFADSGPVVHVAPGHVLSVGGLTITNSILYGWICSLVIIALGVWAARRVSVKPRGGFVQFIEVGVDFIGNMVENAFDNKEIGRKYVPFFVTLFFFIVLNNLSGLLPIVGEGFHRGDYPLLRPFTADLNGTLAMGVVTMILVYGASIREAGGLFKYLRHFFVGNPLNPLYLLIGILEMFTDLTRVFSLSLRLFLNVAIGEVVIGVFSYLGHTYFSPILALPFTLLEMFVAILQAYIFTVLGTMYLAIAVNHATTHEASEDLTDDGVPEKIGVHNPEAVRGQV